VTPESLSSSRRQLGSRGNAQRLGEWGEAPALQMTSWIDKGHMRVDLKWVESLGYQGAIERGPAGICAVQQLLYSGALVVGIDPFEHTGRYCYESVELASAALATWDGEGDPPGPWIKFKSASCERLGPGSLIESN